MDAPAAAGPCRICGHAADNRRHHVREMMFGLRDTFAYVECAACGCLQIEAVPADLAPYYPRDYYAFRSHEEPPVNAFLKQRRARHAMGRGDLVGALLATRFGPPPWLDWMRTSGAGLDDAILDVGCGAGHLLRDMRRAGFTNLTGVDLYLPPGLAAPKGVRLLQQDLSGTTGTFRHILFNDSFEHLDDPEGTLHHVHRLLDPDGLALVRLPIAGTLAWREYGTDWVQLDAPRHMFLHTPRSMHVLAERTGFEVAGVHWNSTAFQFWGSEQYRHDIPLHDPRSYLHGARGSIFTPARIREFEARAAELNEQGDGDSAAFYLRRR